MSLTSTVFEAAVSARHTPIRCVPRHRALPRMHATALLTQFNVRYNGTTLQCPEVSPFFERLRLELKGVASYWRASSDAAQLMALAFGAWFGSEIDLSGVAFGVEAYRGSEDAALLSSLPATVTTLDMAASTWATPEALQALMRSPAATSITRLNLEGNRTLPASALAVLHRASSLVELNCTGCPLLPESSRRLLSGAELTSARGSSAVALDSLRKADEAATRLQQRVVACRMALMVISTEPQGARVSMAELDATVSRIDGIQSRIRAAALSGEPGEADVVRSACDERLRVSKAMMATLDAAEHALTGAIDAVDDLQRKARDCLSGLSEHADAEGGFERDATMSEAAIIADFVQSAQRLLDLSGEEGDRLRENVPMEPLKGAIVRLAKRQEELKTVVNDGALTASSVWDGRRLATLPLGADITKIDRALDAAVQAVAAARQDVAEAALAAERSLRRHTSEIEAVVRQACNAALAARSCEVWRGKRESLAYLLAEVDKLRRQVAPLADGDAAAQVSEVVEGLRATKEIVDAAETALLAAQQRLDAETLRERQGRGVPTIETCREEVKRCRAEASSAQTGRRALIARAIQLANESFPELRCSEFVAELGDKISAAGVPRRDIDEYANRVPLHRHVGAGSDRHMLQRASHEGRDRVLKGFPLHTPAALAGLEREVRIMNEVNHDAVIRVTAYSIEEHKTHSTAWLELPYAECGDLTFVAGQREPIQTLKPWEVQSLMRQAVCGLAALASHGIVHKDIKPGNLLRMGDGRLVITDFDVSKRSDESTVTGHGAGTEGYIAPEVLTGNTSSHKSDMYALGVVMFQLTVREMPRPAEGDVVHIVPESLDDPHLQDLLKQLFASVPEQRPSAVEALMHPYFCQSLTAGLVQGGELLPREAKVKAMRKALAKARRRHNWRSAEPTLMPVIRADARGWLNTFDSLYQTDLLGRRLNIEFIDEAGIDSGGLTTEWYRLLFEESTLSCQDRGGTAAHVLHLPEPGGTVLPRKAAPETQCYHMGIAIVKVMYDGRFVTVPLSLALCKFLVECLVDGMSVTYTMSDLEKFDPSLANGYHQLMAAPADELEGLDLDFEGLRDDGAEQRVTAANCKEYVRLSVRHDLVESRWGQLGELCRGMLAALTKLEVAEPARLLTPADWLLLLCGDPNVTAQAVLSAATWQGFGHDKRGRRTREWLEAAILDMHSDELLRLCQFMTSAPRIPTGGQLKFRALNTSVPGKLPQAHTCFCLMDVPCNADSSEELRRRISWSLEQTSGFDFS